MKILIAMFVLVAFLVRAEEPKLAVDAKGSPQIEVDGKAVVYFTKAKTDKPEKKDQKKAERWTDGLPIYGANETPEPFKPFYRREDIEAMKKAHPQCFDGKCEIKEEKVKVQEIKVSVTKNGKKHEIWPETGLPIYDDNEMPPPDQAFHKKSEIIRVIDFNSKTACYSSGGKCAPARSK